MASRNKNDIPVDRKKADELLYRSLRAVYHFEKSLEVRFGLGYQEIYLLQLLRRRESVRVSEIASALGIQVFSATRLVQRLESLNYISKERAGYDHRVVMVRLEAEGDRFVDGVEAFSYELIGGNAALLNRDGQAAFIRVAESIDQVLGVEDLIEDDK